MENQVKANLSNYRKLEDWLNMNDIEYVKVNEYQYRIMGSVALVDVWAARMTVHVVATEGNDPNQYFRLDYNFNPVQLRAVLEGKYYARSRKH